MTEEENIILNNLHIVVILWCWISKFEILLPLKLNKSLMSLFQSFNGHILRTKIHRNIVFFLSTIVLYNFWLHISIPIPSFNGINKMKREKIEINWYTKKTKMLPTLVPQLVLVSLIINGSFLFKRKRYRVFNCQNEYHFYELIKNQRRYLLLLHVGLPNWCLVHIASYIICII